MEPETKKLRNEVFRKIGRNVFIYQQFEIMLKSLVTYGNFSGYVCDLQDNLEKQKERVMRKTLGQLTGQFLENTHGEYQEIGEERTELKEKKMHMSFSFQVQADEEYYQKTKENLERIVKERNDLIHHLPLNFNLNTLEGLREAEIYLDAQRENILPEYENVRRHLKSLKEMRKEASDYIASDEFIRQWELNQLRHEYVVKLLGRIIEVAKRNDGWTLLNHAGKLLSENAPDQLKDIKKKYSCKTLKDLILKTEIFDVEEESTPNGGRRAIYRLKDGWRLETGPDNQISA